jgi:hypothetical protein
MPGRWVTGCGRRPSTGSVRRRPAILELRSWAIFVALVAVFQSHPGLAFLAPGRAVDSPAGLAITERPLEQLARVSHDERRSADAARFLLSKALMLVTTPPGASVADAELRGELVRRKRAALLTLPPGRCHKVERAAGHLFGSEDDVGSNTSSGWTSSLAACDPPLAGSKPLGGTRGRLEVRAL